LPATCLKKRALILLDERGKTPDSPGLRRHASKRLARTHGRRDLVIAIGEAAGLNPGIARQADARFHFEDEPGRITGAASCVAEQLYPRRTILSGHSLSPCIKTRLCAETSRTPTPFGSPLRNKFDPPGTKLVHGALTPKIRYGKTMLEFPTRKAIVWRFRACRPHGLSPVKTELCSFLVIAFWPPTADAAF